MIRPDRDRVQVVLYDEGDPETRPPTPGFWYTEDWPNAIPLAHDASADTYSRDRYCEDRDGTRYNGAYKHANLFFAPVPGDTLTNVDVIIYVETDGPIIRVYDRGASPPADEYQANQGTLLASYTPAIGKRTVSFDDIALAPERVCIQVAGVGASDWVRIYDVQGFTATDPGGGGGDPGDPGGGGGGGVVPGAPSVVMVY